MPNSAEAEAVFPGEQQALSAAFVRRMARGLTPLRPVLVPLFPLLPPVQGPARYT